MSISSIMSVGRQACNYGKRILNAAPELMFGTSSEAAGKAMREASGSIFNKAQAGWQAVESAGKGSFFKGFWGNIKSFIPDMKTAISKGSAEAVAAGSSAFKGGAKGLFKGLGKKMPFIGAAMMMLCEVPNIFKATTEQGIFSGIAETAKAGARLTGGGVGAAIGSAICPGIGSIVGWIAGEWLAGRIVGKTYSEKQAEKEELIAKYTQQQTQQVQQPQVTVNPFMTNPYNFGNQTPFTGGYNMAQDPYADDIMMQQLGFNAMA